jgi:DNA gyrase subunit A
VVGIMLVDETSEAMLISQFGKIIRIDTKTIREAGRSTQGVRLLHLEEGDRVASAVVLQEKVEEDTNGTLLQ